MFILLFRVYQHRHIIRLIKLIIKILFTTFWYVNFWNLPLSSCCYILEINMSDLYWRTTLSKNLENGIKVNIWICCILLHYFFNCLLFDFFRNWENEKNDLTLVLGWKTSKILSKFSYEFATFWFINFRLYYYSFSRIPEKEK